MSKAAGADETMPGELNGGGSVPHTHLAAEREWRPLLPCVDRSGWIFWEALMNRRYPEYPLVGVGAIIFREDKVLLVQRGKEPAYGKWSIPGGLVELGESLETAVRREVAEEVNLDVRVKNLVAALDRVMPDSAGKIEYHYILLDFICESGDEEPAPASDVMDCVFASLNDLSRFNMTTGTEKVIRRAFAQSKESAFPVYDAEI